MSSRSWSTTGTSPPLANAQTSVCHARNPPGSDIVVSPQLLKCGEKRIHGNQIRRAGVVDEKKIYMFGAKLSEALLKTFPSALGVVVPIYVKGVLPTLQRSAESRGSGDHCACWPLKPSQVSRRTRRVDTELRCNRDLVAAPAYKSAKFGLCRSQTVYPRGVEMPNSLLECFAQQPLAMPF